MRNIYKFYSFVALVAISALSVMAQPVAVTNGGFESSVDPSLDPVDGWAYTASTEGTPLPIVEFAEETSDVQEGARALHTYCDQLGEKDWSQQVGNDQFTVEGGKYYRISLWVKDPSNREIGDTCKLSFTCGMTNNVDTWNEQGRYLGGQTVVPTEWTEWRLALAPTQEQLDADILPYMSTHLRSVGQCLVDNFTVTRTHVLVGNVAEDGASIIMTFTLPIDATTADAANFGVTVDGTANVVTAVAEGDNSEDLVLTLTDAVADGAEVVVTYTQGSLAGTDATVIDGFTESLQSSGSTGPSAVNDIVSSDVNIYPNPASGMVYISELENVNQIQLIDATGRIIKSVSGSDITNVDVSDVNTGLYFMLINTEDGNIFSNRLVVK